MASTVYCDEAGYTGDDLQSKRFYAGVALEAGEAAEIVPQPAAQSSCSS